MFFFFSLVILTTSCWPREEKDHGVAGAKGAVGVLEQSLQGNKVKSFI